LCATQRTKDIFFESPTNPVESKKMAMSGGEHHHLPVHANKENTNNPTITDRAPAILDYRRVHAFDAILPCTLDEGFQQVA
jgi:hypothetical protein